MQETQVWSLGWEDTLEKEMATHFRILAWEISCTEESGRLQSMGSQKSRHDLVTKQQGSTGQWTWGNDNFSFYDLTLIDCDQFSISRVTAFLKILGSTYFSWSLRHLLPRVKSMDHRIRRVLTPAPSSTSSFPGGSDGKESTSNEGDPGWLLVWENPLEKGMATYSSMLAGKFHGQRRLVSHNLWHEFAKSQTRPSD